MTINTNRNTIGKIMGFFHWNQGEYPISAVQPASSNSTPNRPPRRRKINSVAPSEHSNNITIISHNNAYVHDIDDDELEEKSSNKVNQDGNLHI